MCRLQDLGTQTGPRASGPYLLIVSASAVRSLRLAIPSAITSDYPLTTGSVLHRSGLSGYYDLCWLLFALRTTSR